MGTFHYVGLGVLLGKGRAAVEAATTESAEDLAGKASDAAPYVSGTLSGSVHVESVEWHGLRIVATVATGGESSDYAIIVHEGHRRDGSYEREAGPSKFLEGPLIEHAPVYAEAMARAARGQF